MPLWLLFLLSLLSGVVPTPPRADVRPVVYLQDGQFWIEGLTPAPIPFDRIEVRDQENQTWIYTGHFITDSTLDLGGPSVLVRP